MGGENLTKPFRRVDLRKECELSHVGDIKGPARLSGGLKQPIGCRQREHVVVKENGKARRGIHTNENSFSQCCENVIHQVAFIVSVSDPTKVLAY